jgi:hypothetical protein
VAILKEKTVWIRPGMRLPARAWQLTPTEQNHVKDAVRILRRLLGRRRFGEAVGIGYRSTRHITESKRRVSAGMALRVARLAGVSVETILAGKWKGPRPCQTCGHPWIGTPKSRTDKLASIQRDARQGAVMKARGAGRPPVPKKLAKGSLLSVRFSEEERRALDRSAKRDGVRLSEWARRVLLASAASAG